MHHEQYLARRECGHWQELTTAYRTALRAARRVGDRQGQALAHRGLASSQLWRGRYDDAHPHLRQALDLYDQLGDATGLAVIHHNLGVAIAKNRPGHRVDALGHAQQSLDLFRATGNHNAEAHALNLLAWCHMQTGDHHQAITDCQQAQALLRAHDIADPPGEAYIWDSLGLAHHHLGHHRQAADCYQRTLVLYRGLGVRDVEAATLVRLGDTHHASGDLEAARRAWRQALTLLTEIDHPDADAIRAKLDDRAEPAVYSTTDIVPVTQGRS